MTERDRLDFGGLWNGLSYIVLGLVALAVFVFYGDPVDTGGVIASIALVGIGVAAVLAQKLSPLFAELNRYWTGLFWALCGLGILGLGLLSSTKRASSGVLGVLFVIYGVLIAFDR
ncbi:hypothetical protein ACT4ML_14765 [Natrinema sp. LN54]|uniref:hypothetical protein n=1 Tax=Natrinema sp. LN54 TaxID=3458705 RepID=UPI0040352DCF